MFKVIYKVNVIISIWLHVVRLMIRIFILRIKKINKQIRINLNM